MWFVTRPSRIGLLAALLATAMGAPAHARPAVSEIVVEARTGRVLHARDADRSRRPASIAKVVTLFLVFDALDAGELRLGRRIKISRRAASREPSRMGLRAGTRMTVSDAMRGVAVQSANDAVVLAEALAGDERRFARLMTAKARRLGMRHTVFGDATGLPDTGTRTTARDVAMLARELLRTHPDRYPLFGRRAIRWGGRTMANHNRLLGRVAGVDGIKTGYTARPGRRS